MRLQRHFPRMKEEIGDTDSKDISRIPNYNTLSTLIDRLSIENVKLAHFHMIVEEGKLLEADLERFQNRIIIQREFIEALEKELAHFLRHVCKCGKYKYLKEERTFV